MSTADRSPRRSRPIWFAAKRYGWGWGLPVCWQGWVVLGLWLVVIVSVAPLLIRYGEIWFIAFMLVMSAVLIAVCYARGEPLRWRWGK